jgi:hypothetical protein
MPSNEIDVEHISLDDYIKLSKARKMFENKEQTEVCHRCSKVTSVIEVI